MNNTDLFLKVFPNIPIPERQNAIYVDSQYGPLSWNVVWLEVKAGSEVGLRACQFLKDVKII